MYGLTLKKALLLGVSLRSLTCISNFRFTTSVLAVLSHPILFAWPSILIAERILISLSSGICLNHFPAELDSVQYPLEG